METMTQRLARLLAKIDSRVEMEELATYLERPADAGHGDLSLPCFKLSKKLRRSPQDIASDWAARLQDESIGQVHAVSGYLNVSFQRLWYTRHVLADMERLGEHYGASERGNGKTVVIDYSSPNIAKPFHIAHLRSTVIGQSLQRILTFAGYRCIGVNHLGDWGTQFGKLLAAYNHWGSEESVSRDGMDELLRLYVRFHEASTDQPELEDEARDWFVRLETGEAEVRERWKWFVEISLTEFKRLYSMLGVSFDAYTGESFYNDKMSAVLDELRQKQLLEEDQGAQVVRLESYDMPPVLMLKTDGSSLYPTRDITAALYRKAHYGSDTLIYVTDYSQQLHFQQWFKVIERMGYSWSDELVHVPFGRVSFQGEGLSTRKGNVVKLEDVLQQAVRKTEALMLERGTAPENLSEIAHAVGVGAVIFHDLSRNRMHDVSFDWEQVLHFEGETGPYVQYTHARACRLLKRGGTQVACNGLEQHVEHLTDEAAWSLIKLLHRFPERISQAEHKLEPSIMSRTLIELAQGFNRFYRDCPIFTEAPSVQEARLRLVRATVQTLKTGLYLIGMQAPESI